MFLHNQLVSNSNQSNTTMTSLEIAELTGKEHRNVRRDIEKMLLELELDTLKFEQTYLDSLNREQKQYSLPRDEVICLVSGY